LQPRTEPDHARPAVECYGVTMLWTSSSSTLIALGTFGFDVLVEPSIVLFLSVAAWAAGSAATRAVVIVSYWVAKPAAIWYSRARVNQLSKPAQAPRRAEPHFETLGVEG